MKLKSELSEYTEAEFIEILNELFTGVSDTKKNT
ncbi:bacteriocin immunity protein, partial [Pseudomonas syringae]